MAKTYNMDRYQLVDGATGEVVDVDGDLIKLDIGDSYRVKSQDDFYKNHTLFGKGETFVKLYDRARDILEEKYKDDNATRLLIYDLCKYVEYDTNILKINGHFATITDIARDKGKDKSTISRSFKKLIQGGVIAKTTVGNISDDKKDTRTVYIVNPYIYTRGKTILTSVVKIFEETGWDKI